MELIRSDHALQNVRTDIKYAINAGDLITIEIQKAMIKEYHAYKAREKSLQRWCDYQTQRGKVTH